MAGDAGGLKTDAGTSVAAPSNTDEFIRCLAFTCTADSEARALSGYSGNGQKHENKLYLFICRPSCAVCF